MNRTWLCEECGSPADGDRCMKCGATPTFAMENRTAPGSYAALMGWPRTALASKYFGLHMILYFSIMVVGLMFVDRQAGPWILGIAGLLVARAIVWPLLKAFGQRLYARLRFRP